jgi:hypothetical protein
MTICYQQKSYLPNAQHKNLGMALAQVGASWLPPTIST